MKTILLTPSLLLSSVLLAPGLWAQETYALSDRPATVEAVPAEPVAPGATAGLRFNFRGAPLETVLNYMSEAAGFVIVLNTPIRGTVDMWSDQPVTSVEAVQLLNIALNKNGYAASVQGRNLVVSSKDEAKKSNIPIHTGNDPAAIPPTAEMVMQIIPLRHINAQQAATDLASLLPDTANLTANQDSNSLIVTDTQINVRHVVEIVAALDGSSDSVAALRVFRLRNADPVEMAQLLTNLFQSSSGTGAQANPALAGLQGLIAARIGGGGGFPGGGFGGATAFGSTGTTASSGRSNRSSRNGGSSGATAAGRATQVVAVADPRTFSIVVAADKDQMAGIADMIAKLDGNSARKQKVYVYTMENADVHQVEAILKNLFQSSSARSSNSTQADPLGTRANTNSQATSPTSTLSLDGNSRGGR